MPSAGARWPLGAAEVAASEYSESSVAELRRTAPLSQSMPDAIFRLAATLGRISYMPLDQTITFGQMRRSGPRRLQVSCGDHKCSHSVVIDVDCWPESLRLCDLEALFVCSVCGHRGADVRRDYQRPASTG